MMTRQNLQRVVVLAALILGLGAVAAFGYTRAVAQGPSNGACSPEHMVGMMGQQGMISGMGSGMMGQGSAQSSEQCPFMSGMMNGMMSGTVDKFGPGQGMMGAWSPAVELRPTADKP